jgi:hypothetical protein
MERVTVVGVDVVEYSICTGQINVFRDLSLCCNVKPYSAFTLKYSHAGG